MPVISLTGTRRCHRSGPNAHVATDLHGQFDDPDVIIPLSARDTRVGVVDETRPGLVRSDSP
jgi:hypothetical protein